MFFEWSGILIWKSLFNAIISYELITVWEVVLHCVLIFYFRQRGTPRLNLRRSGRPRSRRKAGVRPSKKGWGRNEMWWWRRGWMDYDAWDFSPSKTFCVLHFWQFFSVFCLKTFHLFSNSDSSFPISRKFLCFLFALLGIMMFFSYGFQLSI